MSTLVVLTISIITGYIAFNTNVWTGMFNSAMKVLSFAGFVSFLLSLFYWLGWATDSHLEFTAKVFVSCIKDKLVRLIFLLTFSATLLTGVSLYFSEPMFIYFALTVSALAVISSTYLVVLAGPLLRGKNGESVLTHHGSVVNIERIKASTVVLILCTAIASSCGGMLIYFLYKSNI